MAARVNFAKHFGVAAATGLATFVSMPVALADSKKSIYDDDNSESVAPVPGTTEPAGESKTSQQDAVEESLSIQNKKFGAVSVKSSAFLEDHIEVARKWLHTQTNTAAQYVDGVFQKYLHVEQSVTSTVAGLKSEHEDLLPGGIYILIATLSGSVFAHRRNFVVRGLAPVVFGLAGFSYFLPETFANTRNLVWSYEQKVPAIADTHVKVQSQLEELVSGAESAAVQGREILESSVHETRKFVADTTGLQISDEPKKSK